MQTRVLRYRCADGPRASRTEERGTSMENAPKTTIAAMIAIALSAAPLAACGGQTSQDATDDTAGQTQAASIDVSSWKTLGDALAYDASTNSSASWDEEHYITMFTATDGSVVRVVAKMDEDTYDEHAALDMSDDDYQEKFLEVMGDLELESAEDLTGQRLTQDEMDAYVGKTGQDLVDDGFAFESYWMYGGDETGAVMAKGPLAYNVTFDVSIPDEKAEDGGASIMGATITDAVYAGASVDATDPSTL